MATGIVSNKAYVIYIFNSVLLPSFANLSLENCKNPKKKIPIISEAKILDVKGR